MTNPIDTNNDIIDVRDIIERVEELDGQAQTGEENAEFNTLQALLDELAGNGGDEQWRGDWYPVTLIRDSHFESYMDDMVADCYEIPKDMPSFMTITLDYVALRMDYISVDIDGVTYWYR